MDKKTLATLVEEIVANTAKKHGLEESEARTLVGIALKKNRAAFEACVSLPSLVLAEQPAPVALAAA